MTSGDPGAVSSDGVDDSVRPPVVVGGAARDELMALLADDDAPAGARALRISVSGIAGNEYRYDLDLIGRDDVGPDDHVVDQDGIMLVIPPGSVAALRGSTLDRPMGAGAVGLVLRNPNRPAPLTLTDLPTSGDVAERVRILLDRVINPGLSSHDGHAEILEIDEAAGRIVVTMGGRCQGCAVSDLTLRATIARTITEYVPEIREVVDATDHTRGENPFFR